MAAPWTIRRDQRNGGGSDDLRAALRQVGSWSRRAFFTRPNRSTVGTIRTRRAVVILAVMTIMAVVLTWATVSIASRGIADSEAAVSISGGPLVIPAPGVAGGLPLRLGSISREGAGPIVAELRRRFGAVAAGLIADARRPAAAAAHGSSASQTSQAGAAARPVTASWTSGLYGQPGHIDPVTGRFAWVMYLGLDATAKLGTPSDVVGRLMLVILGPDAKVSRLQVAAGQRGGSANCAIAWFARTKVSVCGWASDHTIGALASPARDTSVAELAMLMIKMRLDLQSQ